MLPSLFGGKVAFAVSACGILLGVLLLAYLVRTVSGWGEIVGVVAFVLIFGFAWTLGLVLELLRFLVRKMSRTPGGKQRT